MADMMLKNMQNLSLQLKETLRMSSFYSEELIAEKLLTLIEQETGFQMNILDAISIPIYVKDLQGLIIYANQAYADLIQHPLELIINKHISELGGSAVESIEMHRRMDLELERIKRPLIYEYEYIKSDGQVLPVYIFKDLLLDEYQKPYRIIGSIVNISHLKYRIQGFDRLKQAKNRLEDLSKQMNQAGIREIADVLVSTAIELLGKQLVGSFIIMNKENEMSWVTGVGYDLDSLKDLTLDYKKSLQWMVGKDLVNEMIKIDDMRDLPEIVPNLLLNEFGQSIRSLVSIPLVVDGNLFAFISIESSEPRIFNSIDMELLGILKCDYEFLIENYLLRLELERAKVLDGGSGLLNRGELEKFINQKIDFVDSRGCLIQFELIEYDQLIDLLGWQSSEHILSQIVEAIKKDLHTLQIGYRLDYNKLIFYSKVMDRDFEVEIDKVMNRIYYKGVQCKKGVVHLALNTTTCNVEQLLLHECHFSKLFNENSNNQNENFIKSKPMFIES